MTIEIWSVGKESDDFIEKGLQFYLNRIKPFCKGSIVLLPPPKRTTAMPQETLMQQEEKIILNRLDSQKHKLILLDEGGKMMTSEDWAAALMKFQMQRTKTLVLLIGGPWGVTENVKKAATQVWSLSQLTFPHQLVRLIVCEQLYRSFSILNHSGYHHR